MRFRPPLFSLCLRRGRNPFAREHYASSRKRISPSSTPSSRVAKSRATTRSSSTIRFTAWMRRHVPPRRWWKVTWSKTKDGAGPFGYGRDLRSMMAKGCARDCVASIRRWWRRDPLGQLLAMRAEEISAADDRRLTIRLARPFAPILDALDKLASPICVIMPERIANTDPWQPLSEVVGSGPFCFLAEERLPGGCPPSTGGSKVIVPAMAAGPNGRRARSAAGSTVSSGTSCPIPRPPPTPTPPCSVGRLIGGSSLPSTYCRCCAARPI